jgi:hypothetical protein
MKLLYRTWTNFTTIIVFCINRGGWVDMKLHLTGDLTHLMQGIAIAAKEMGVELSADGYKVDVTQHEENVIEVTSSGGQASIRYSRKIHFFRAFGLLVEELRSKKSEFHW